jgi:hypothetical protein
LVTLLSTLVKDGAPGLLSVIDLSGGLTGLGLGLLGLWFLGGGRLLVGLALSGGFGWICWIGKDPYAYQDLFWVTISGSATLKAQ